MSAPEDARGADDARAADEAHAWLWGWDPTPAIVSVWAEADGRATVWRRPRGAALVREEVRFRPWLVLASLDDLAHAGARLVPEPPAGTAPPPGAFTHQTLDGPGALRHLVRADDGRALHAAVLAGASRRLGRPLRHVRELGAAEVLALPPEEQYLVATGRTYFRDLDFDDLRRAQLDLETTGLDPETERVFLIALRGPDGDSETLEAAGDDDLAEADLLNRLVARIRALDPDVIENHNLHGFDLPFLAVRAERLGVSLALGRAGTGLVARPSSRGAARELDPARRRVRYTVPGRELIDTLDAVWRHDFAARDLPGHGLKAVARHLGLADADRELIPGAQVHEVFRRDPARVRRYARADVEEAAGVARVFGGAAFGLARMAPRRYERLADAGAATGVIDPLLVRAYLHAGAALPAHEPGDGTPHHGAALHLFASGVAHRIVKADVASLYPSLMRAHRIGPARDRLGVMLALVDRLVELRLAAKARARAAAPGSAARFGDEALSAAMKLVVNSAYGYLAAVGLTRFADVHAANRVTAHGRALLSLLCRALAERGVTLVEADTDGVFFAVPPSWSEDDERRVVREVGALLPPLVHLEHDGRYAAMLSHEPKNYALAPYEGPLVLRGVAFRSRRAEPFGEDFLRRAIACLLAGDVPGAQAVYLDTIAALRGRRLPTRAVASRVRLTRTPEEYAATRAQRRELPYEALLAAGRTAWSPGERIAVYRAQGDRAALVPEPDEEDEAESELGSVPESEPEPGSEPVPGSGSEPEPGSEPVPGSVPEPAVDLTFPPDDGDPRDYDVEHYVRTLRTHFAARLATAFTPDDFAALFGDPDQLTLFAPPLASIRPILTELPVDLDALDAAENANGPF